MQQQQQQQQQWPFRNINAADTVVTQYNNCDGISPFGHRRYDGLCALCANAFCIEISIKSSNTVPCLRSFCLVSVACLYSRCTLFRLTVFDTFLFAFRLLLHILSCLLFSSPKRISPNFGRSFFHWYF